MTRSSRLVVTVLAAILSRPSGAAEMTVHDLSSLVHLAAVVVEVRELDARDVGDVGTVRRERVEVMRVFKGDAAPGQQLVVDVPVTYRRHLAEDAPHTVVGKDGKKTHHKPEPLEITTAFLFLVRSPDGSGLVPVPSGIKLARKTDVLRYDQVLSPGPYVLVPQRGELLEHPATAPYTAAELRRDVELAGKRVEAFTAALQSRDPKRLVTFLRRSGDGWPSRDDVLSAGAAGVLSQSGPVALVFSLIAARRPPYEAATLAELQSTFATPDRLEKLLADVESGRLRDDDVVLALDLVAANTAAGSFNDLPLAARGARASAFGQAVVERITALLASSRESTRTLAAARAIALWHPARSRPPAVADDPAMRALRRALETATDPDVKYELMTISCQLGGRAAYRDIVGDTIYLLASSPTVSGDAGTFRVLAHALDASSWKAIRKAPVLTARALDGPTRDTVHSARADPATEARWQEYRERYGNFTGGLPCATTFDPPLPPGTYEVRVRATYVEGGKELSWWGLARVMQL